MRCLLARVGAGAWVGRGQLGHLLAQLRQQLRLFLLHGVQLALHFLKVFTHGGEGRVGQRAGGAALGRVAAACEVGLGNGLGFVGRFVALGVHQNHLQRRVFKHALKAFGVDETHRQCGSMDDG